MISSVWLRDGYFIKVTVDKLTHFPTDISQMKHANTIPINKKVTGLTEKNSINIKLSYDILKINSLETWFSYLLKIYVLLFMGVSIKK